MRLYSAEESRLAALRSYARQVWVEPYGAPASSLLLPAALLLLALAAFTLRWSSGPALLISSMAGPLCLLRQTAPAGDRLCRGQNLVAFIPAARSLRERLVLVVPAGAGAGAGRLPAGRALTAGVLLVQAAVLLHRWAPHSLWEGTAAVAGLLLLFQAAGGGVRGGGRPGGRPGLEQEPQSGAGPADGGPADAGPLIAAAVGRAVAALPLAHTELWVVYTGPGLAGLDRFLAAHRPLMADAHLLLLAGTGTGRLGLLPGRAGAATVQALRRAGVQPLEPSGASGCTGLGVGAIPSVPPLPTLVAGLSEPAAEPDPALVAEAARLLIAAARQIDGRAPSGVVN